MCEGEKGRRGWSFFWRRGSAVPTLLACPPPPSPRPVSAYNNPETQTRGQPRHKQPSDNDPPHTHTLEHCGCCPIHAPPPLAVGVDAQLNVNGGACALGHPLGATGAKLMTTLVHELHRSDKRFGLQAICEGGGTANATIIERC